jgi:hypothetical protein
MRGFAGLSGFALVLLLAAPVHADPVMFQPEGCDFQMSFPASPDQSQIKTATNRGDGVITNKAQLRVGLDGKTNFFRADCTRIAHMGFIDEAILRDNMNELAVAYKLQGAIVSVEQNRRTGSVGRIQGRAQLGGKDVQLNIYRYTGENDILDIWIGADPDAFPSAANAAFLSAIKLNGSALR